MIATIVTFRHGSGTYDRGRLEALSHSTAPKYQGMAGLIAKTYWYDDERREHGGFYVWETREAAEAVHTPEHVARLEGLYGVRPDVRYVDAPIYIDNG